MDAQKATSREIDFISEEFLGAGPFGIMTNPLTYSSMMRRTAEGAAYTPSKLLLSVDKSGYNSPRTKVAVDPTETAEWIRMRFLGCVFSQAFDIADRNIGTTASNFGSMIALGYKQGIFDLMASLGGKRSAVTRTSCGCSSVPVSQNPQSPFKSTSISRGTSWSTRRME